MVKSSRITKKFLKAKGLEGEFNRFRKYQRLARFKYDVGGRTVQGYLTKKNNKTLILDNKFRVIGKSKFSINKIRQSADNKVIKKTIKGDITRIERAYEIPFKRKSTVSFANDKTKIISNKPITRKLGRVGITLKAWKGRQHVTVTGGSQALRNLSKASSRNAALDEAERGAWSQIPFSPDKIEVIDIEFVYFVRTKKA